MELEDIKRKEKRDVIISVRTTTEGSKWMATHKVSPSKLFQKALAELMAKQP